MKNNMRLLIFFILIIMFFSSVIILFTINNNENEIIIKPQVNNKLISSPKNDNNNQSNIDKNIPGSVSAPQNTEKFNSLALVNSQKTFSKIGSGNNELIKVNSSFSIFQTGLINNSFNFNQTLNKTFSIVNNPTYNNYTLINGNYTISNVKSAIGVETVEGSNKIIELNSSRYSSIAASFVVNGNVNISSIYIYLNEFQNSGNQSNRIFNISIRKISSGAPNGSQLFTSQIPYRGKFFGFLS